MGNKEAGPILIDGLKKLEYRGYDSAGIAVINSGSIECLKSKGKVADLEKKLSEKINCGICWHRPYAMGDPWGAQ